MHKTVTLIAPDGVRFDARVQTPPNGPGPGLFVLGADDVDAACARYAAEGYTTVVLDSARHRTHDAQPPSDTRTKVLADLYLAKSALAADVAGGAWGAIGVGVGSAVVWRAALHGAVAAAVVSGIAPIGNELREAAALTVPVAVHLDGAEAERYPTDLAALREAAGRTRLRVYTYADVSDPHAERLAHSRSLAVLRPVLGPHYDLARLFQEHLAYEFVERDADATMETMVDQPYVNHVPTLTGGVGHDMLKRFYRYHFIPNLPQDRASVVLSEIVGADTVVLELVTRFTHTEEIDYLLPGIAPTGTVLEIPTVVIAKFRGDKLYHEHIYWDQASLLVQLGLLDPTGLPVAGAEEARKMLDQHRPANELMARWRESEGKPLSAPTASR